MANTSGGLLTVDEDGVIVFANPALEHILGYQPDELVGQPLQTLVPDHLEQDPMQAFQRYLQTGERQKDWNDIGLTAKHNEGHEVPVSIRFQEHTHHGQRLFTGTLRDNTDREQRRNELERYEDIITHLPEGIYRTEACPDGNFVEGNAALREMLDVPSIDALRQKGPEDFYANPDEREVLEERLHEDEILSDHELKVQTATGETIWTSVTAIKREEHGEIYFDGVVEDITERKEREERFRAFREAVEQAGHSIYMTDPDGTIEYVNPAFESITGYSEEDACGETPRLFSSNEHDDDFYADLWETIKSGDVWQGEVTNQRKNGDQYVVNQTIAPVKDENGDIERFVAVNADITEQKERERTLERQRAALKCIKKMTENLRPLNRALSRVSTQAEIEQVVCEHLAMSDTYLFAWYGDYTPEREQVTPQEWAGVEAGYVDDFELATDESDVGHRLISQAVHTRDVQASRNVLSDPVYESWREDALARGYQSLAAVPVVFGDTVYGVTVVYSSRPNAFDEYEKGLLRELGERVGHAVHAAENERLLHTDTVTELEFQTTGAESVPVQVAEELDCRFEFETVVPTSENGFLCYAAVEDATPETVIEYLSNSPTVDHARAINATGTQGMIEYRVSESPMTKLLDYGATVTSKVVEDGEETIVAEVAPDSNTRKVISGVQAAYPDTTFVAKRSVDRPVQSINLTHDVLDDLLTDRQREVLELAYHAGFFESPRCSTGDELAAALGIASPTFYLHVRKATRKILEQIDEIGLFD
ncbi:PAS domain S-box protein [Haloferax mediterranei ATCC 33500]|uniref:Bacterio-opsin activator-like protein n=1 Tax=Haloferax mediterranei (strain ATCC 33500 / DSM 1411 / JCM 8866 / NBRC 14739 / NCIMB 2177 / R-4) TaxID=523841 RepID=I3R790_HALMT|nr:PAS domain S-box protein [Haloferax mediterranei]AFK20100.1 bacterio-opsin activator-like protein [Haloferax mediterranei ATCC 33500]AHZ23474.1 transcriptional regulator [Haloferax mediterranei ATCC 33500]ELZ99646.1 bacterio-opsin activator-like protein [Haloferax mediterranei ATCC 33500]MDX5987150.1 PAS domain S-box protein [Haloferax mediterranei ATCC 33500]QCQ76461.1 PAS domain S-box protein [Haloferax mediterranei ATCC 33500]